MLHYPHEKGPSGRRGEAAVAFRPAPRGARLPEAECEGRGLYRIRASRNGMGARDWRQLLLYLLFVGCGSLQRQGLCKGVDGTLSGRCADAWKIGRLHARCGKAESVAFGPVFCPEVRLRGRRYDRQRLRAAGALLRRNDPEIRGKCEKNDYRKSDADRLLRYAVPLYPRQSGNDKTTLRSARCPGGFHRGGYAPQGQGAALRIQ